MNLQEISLKKSDAYSQYCLLEMALVYGVSDTTKCLMRVENVRQKI